MPLALIRQWQTAALLLLILGFALGPVSLPGYGLTSLPLDWLGLAVPFAASMATMRLGQRRMAALCSVVGACVGSVLFWWLLDVAVRGIVAEGLTAGTLASGLLACGLVGATATFSGVTGSLWNLPDSPPRRELAAGRSGRRAIRSGLRG